MRWSVGPEVQYYICLFTYRKGVEPNCSSLFASTLLIIVCHSIVLSKSISIITPAAWENAFCIYQNIFASLISIDLDDLGDYAVSASVELMKETNRAEKNTTDQSGRPLNLLKNYELSPRQAAWAVNYALIPMEHQKRRILRFSTIVDRRTHKCEK